MFQQAWRSHIFYHLLFSLLALWGRVRFGTFVVCFFFERRRLWKRESLVVGGTWSERANVLDGNWLLRRNTRRDQHYTI